MKRTILGLTLVLLFGVGFISLAGDTADAAANQPQLLYSCTLACGLEFAECLETHSLSYCRTQRQICRANC